MTSFIDSTNEGDRQDRIRRFRAAKAESLAILAKAEVEKQLRRERFLKVKAESLMLLRDIETVLQRKRTSKPRPTERIVRKTHYSEPVISESKSDRPATVREILGLADELGGAVGTLARQVDELRSEIATLRARTSENFRREG